MKANNDELIIELKSLIKAVKIYQPDIDQSDQLIHCFAKLIFHLIDIRSCCQSMHPSYWKRKKTLHTHVQRDTGEVL